MTNEEFPRIVARLSETSLSTRFGAWREILYHDGQVPIIALVRGEVWQRELVPCRLQSHCLSAFVFGSVECDCREQMEIAQGYIEEKDFGIVIWLDQEGRGHGHMACMLAAKLSRSLNIAETEAYERLGYGADKRSYSAAAQVLHDLNIRSIELLSNNPERAEELGRNGVDVARRKAIIVNPGENEMLYRVYVDKQVQGHVIDLPPMRG